jgi:hypothetical protein
VITVVGDDAEKPLIDVSISERVGEEQSTMGIVNRRFRHFDRLVRHGDQWSLKSATCDPKSQGDNNDAR